MPFLSTLSLITINLISINSFLRNMNQLRIFVFPRTVASKEASLNMNSLSAHIDEIRILLNDKFLDVLAIQETKLNNSHRDSEFYIPRFDLVRRDRISDGDGGVCFYIKSSINFYSEMCCQWFPFRMLHPQVWYSPGNNIGTSTVFAIYQ